MFSMGITMLVFAVTLGDQPISEANNFLLLRSTQFIFAVLSVICCGGIFASLARGKMHNPTGGRFLKHRKPSAPTGGGATENNNH
jgi:hypothetical protein